MSPGLPCLCSIEAGGLEHDGGAVLLTDSLFAEADDVLVSSGELSVGGSSQQNKEEEEKGGRERRRRKRKREINPSALLKGAKYGS